MVVAKVGSDFFRKYKFQILAAAAANIFCFSHGNAASWTATAISILRSDESPLLTGPVTVEEASWIGSLICLGALMGNLVSGLSMDRIGRTNTFLVALLPHIILYVLFIFGNLVWHLYVARFISGLTGGMIYVLVPTFIADVADNKIRGILGSSFVCSVNAGMLSGYILGSYLNYELFPRVLVVLAAICFFPLFRLPDTPQYLLKKKQYEKAEESLKFYRNFKNSTKEEWQEFNEYFTNLKTTVEGGEGAKNSNVTLKDFLEPPVIKGLAIGFGLMIMNQFTGLYAIGSYTSTVFQMSGSTMDPNTCTVIVGAVQLFGTFISVILVDSVGRRILLLVSCTGVTLGYLGLSLFSYFNQFEDLSHISWTAVTSLSFSILLGSFGVTPLPFIVVTEVLPRKVKSTCVTFCICTLSVTSFIVVKLYPVLMVDMGLHGVMWISSGTTFVSAVGIYFFLPETKGKRLERSDGIK